MTASICAIHFEKLEDSQQQSHGHHELAVGGDQGCTPSGHIRGDELLYHGRKQKSAVGDVPSTARRLRIARADPHTHVEGRPHLTTHLLYGDHNKATWRAGGIYSRRHS